MHKRLAIVVTLLAICFLAALALAGCAGQKIGGSVFGHQIRRFHDDTAKVTCWTDGGSGGMTCLPDWFIKHE